MSEEQESLLRHELIILQYPMFWYNMPAILKLWFDSVFAYQFAYGSEGFKLKNKKLLPSLTIGQAEDKCYAEGYFLIDEFLSPVQKTAEYTQMKYLDPVCLYGVSPVEGYTKEEISAKAIKHSLKLIEIIRNA